MGHGYHVSRGCSYPAFNVVAYQFSRRSYLGVRQSLSKKIAAVLVMLQRHPLVGNYVYGLLYVAWKIKSECLVARLGSRQFLGKRLIWDHGVRWLWGGRSRSWFWSRGRSGWLGSRCRSRSWRWMACRSGSWRRSGRSRGGWWSSGGGRLLWLSGRRRWRWWRLIRICWFRN